ncbi:uncharacterized protein B0I36DRAFT_318342 [Microdochium trichocladiopsis]|uniref:Uncharacterized protein n=1 Tax=Microdochium trichocladiopsis TaxID=1682393 RepID=A0A9P9BWU1_9PEZI|nr:uncharacterized protein B0I36DRAFT_318342 [Microdochium trichocladiopsis]KAH7035431.1 hypothetical protein B0I36DRAFT_318342 [Microdochium trichocladiopsis]
MAGSSCCATTSRRLCLGANRTRPRCTGARRTGHRASSTLVTTTTAAARTETPLQTNDVLPTGLPSIRRTAETAPSSWTTTLTMRNTVAGTKSITRMEFTDLRATATTTATTMITATTPRPPALVSTDTRLPRCQYEVARGSDLRRSYPRSTAALAAKRAARNGRRRRRKWHGGGSRASNGLSARRWCVALRGVAWCLASKSAWRASQVQAPWEPAMVVRWMARQAPPAKRRKGRGEPQGLKALTTRTSLAVLL